MKSNIFLDMKLLGLYDDRGRPNIYRMLEIYESARSLGGNIIHSIVEVLMSEICDYVVNNMGLDMCVINDEYVRDLVEVARDIVRNVRKIARLCSTVQEL